LGREKIMRLDRLFFSTLLLSLAVLGPETVRPETEYAIITASRVNIRTAPSTSSGIVGKARKGDVFELHGKKGGWYRIRMFCPAYRYVHRSLVNPTPYVVSAPEKATTRRDIFVALVKAEDRAETEADRKYPVEDRRGRPVSGNVRKHLDYLWLLSDRYKLRVTHSYKVQPPIHDSIIQEGIKRRW
jgi:hypothetical protein